MPPMRIAKKHQPNIFDALMLERLHGPPILSSRMLLSIDMEPGRLKKASCPYTLPSLKTISTMNLEDLAMVSTTLTMILDEGYSIASAISLSVVNRSSAIDACGADVDSILSRFDLKVQQHYKEWKQGRSFNEIEWKKCRKVAPVHCQLPYCELYGLKALQVMYGIDTLTWENYYYFIDEQHELHSLLSLFQNIVATEQGSTPDISSCGQDFEDLKILKEVCKAISARARSINGKIKASNNIIHAATFRGNAIANHGRQKRKKKQL